MGRLDPQSGEIKLVQPAGAPGQMPYALRFLSDGKQPWFSFWGTNKIATVDPKTFQVTEFALPDPKTRVRRMGVTSDDMLWYGDWSNGKLSRFNPKTGEVKTWDGPSGPQSQPYGMTVINDVIWYVESNTRPNNMVRFDPKTEKFQTFADSGGRWRHRASHDADGRRRHRDGDERPEPGRDHGNPAERVELTGGAESLEQLPVPGLVPGTVVLGGANGE